MTHTYCCTDEASEGTSIDIEATSATAALAEYINDALASPDSYNQGEDGVDTTITAYARRESDDGDIDEATGVIDFARAAQCS